MRPIQFLLVGAALSAAISAQSWTQSAAAAPSMRRAGAMAFDPVTSKLLMYGGLTQTPSQALDETWTYNGTWTQLAALAPSRWGHRMVLDGNTNHLLSFGGRSPTISSFSNDLMEWNGTTWATVPTPVRPSARYVYGMCYDRGHNLMVLFGGRTQTGVNDETWQWNGITWAQVPTAHSPPAREEMVMEYEPTLNRVVLFGGHDGDTDTIYGDTWFYDGTDWKQIAPINSPSARYRGAAAVDSNRKRIVLFGGFDGTDILTDTFEFSGDDWVFKSTGTAPGNATETYHGYDPVRARFVVFGGFGGTFSSDTWEYTSANTGLFARFGNNCPTSTSTPTVESTTPTIGQTLTFTFGGLQASDEAVLVTIGFDNLAWQGIPLPLDLGFFGLNGCSLNVAADVLDLSLSLGNPTATYAMALPNLTTLLATPLYVQGLTMDLDGPTLLTGSTRGGRALIGN